MKKTLRGLAVVAVAATMFSAGITAASAALTVSVSPTTGVKAGDTITVTTTGLDGTVGVYASLCKAGASAMAAPTECDPDQSHMAWITGTGTPGSQKDVGRLTAVAAFTSAAGVKVDCLVDACVIYVRGDHNNRTDYSLIRTVAMTFAAGNAAPVKATDVPSATVNGVEVKPNVPGNLTYRVPVELVVTAKSGLPVTLKSLTPDCAVDGTKVTALKGAGTCAIAATTTGNDTYAAFSAAVNFPFYLHPATQTITAKFTAKKVVIGKPLTIKKTQLVSDMNEDVSLTSLTPARCSVKATSTGWVVSGVKAGVCKLEADSAGMLDTFTMGTLTTNLTIVKK